MAQTLELKLRGLFTNYNNLAKAPPGSLSIGNNINIDRESIIEPRRGLVTFSYTLPDAAYRIAQLINFQDYIIAHYGPPTAPCYLAYYDPSPVLRSGATLTGGTDVIYMTNTDDISIGQTVLANEVAEITTVADVGGSLNNTYFFLDNVNSTTRYFVWFNVNGAGTAPFYPDYTGVEVALSLNAPDTDVAAAIQAALNPLTDFNATVLGNVVTVYRAAAGHSFPISDGPGSAATGFTFNNMGSGIPNGTHVVAITPGVSVQISNNIVFSRATAELLFAGWRQYDGTFYTPSTSDGLIHYTLANQNLYITTSTGIKRLDTITGQFMDAGVPKALEIFPSLIGITGFLPNNSRVAYKVQWGYKDAHNNLLLGAPSQRFSIANTNGYNTNVQLVINIPDGITTDFFYQIYRTGISISADIEPSEEFFLVYEDNPTAGEIAAKAVTVIDETPEGLTGAAQYTNPSQEGILQANEVPPQAYDIAQFRNCVFFANTISKQRLELSLLGVSGEFDVTGSTHVGGPIKNTVYNLQISKTGTIAAGSNIITGLANTDSLVLGQAVYGVGIPPNTVISSFISSTSIMINNNATASGAVTLYFELVGITIGQVVLGTNIPTDTQVYDVFIPTNSTGDTTGAGTPIITGIPSTAEFKVGQPISDAGGVIPPDTFIYGINNTTTITLTNNLLADAPEVTDITCPAGNATGLAGSYFRINSAWDATNYYVWYMVDGGGTDPAPGGTGIVVAVSSADTAAQVATATAAAIDLSGDFSVPPPASDTLTVTNTANGPATDATNVNVPGLSITVTTQGRGGNVADVLFLGNGVRLSKDATATASGSTITFKNGISGIQVGDVLTIDGVTYTAAKSEDISAREFKLYAQGTAAQNIDDTVKSLIRVINQNSANTTIYAYGLSSGISLQQSLSNLLPGKFLLESRQLNYPTFYVTLSDHGNAFNPVLPVSGTSVASVNDAFKNGLYYSKISQPDAVPLVNYQFVGSADHPIYRLVALREALYIFKRDGIYRLTGVSPETFRVDLLDSTAIILAPESAVALNNQIYVYTTQGISAVSDTGVSVMSRPIENQLSWLQSNAAEVIFKKGYGIAYEADRKYILLVPESAGDTVNKKAYVYNIFTESWTTWTAHYNCGLINSYDGKLCFGSNRYANCAIERKSKDETDYVDEGFELTLLSISDKELVLSSVLDVSVGDLVVQPQLPAVIIDSIDVTTNTVTVRDKIDYLLGPVTIYKAIPVEIEFIPQVGGNVGIMKHFREVSLFFKEALFQHLWLHFSTELNNAPEPILFKGYGQAFFGLFPFGAMPFGGTTSIMTVRTYIPRSKQYCTQLIMNIQHTEAQSHFALQGVSFIYNPVSERIAR